MTSSLIFTLAPSADLSKTIDAVLTVEAEYGSYVAEGSVYTAAHHQPGMEHLPAPCNDSNIPVLESGTVLVSHVDLDTFGGCLRACGSYSSLFAAENQSFWDLAQFVDLNGAHKLGQSGANETDLARLYAFWAWKQANVERMSRDEITDVTALVHAAGDTIAQILTGNESLIEKGSEMRTAQDKLNADTFVRADGRVAVRLTSFTPEDGLGFCNHLYTEGDDDGTAFAAVASYAKDAKSITISLADAVEGVSCRDIMQDLFGPEAGGHDGIAGTPREQAMTDEDMTSTVAALNAALTAAL